MSSPPLEVSGNTRRVRRTPPDADDDGRLWLDQAYGAHGSEIYGFCRRVTGDAGLAEEITQDVFVRAWRARRQFDGRLASLRTWLFQIARNASIDAHRARSVRPALAGERQHDDRRHGDDLAVAVDEIDRLADRWLVESSLRRLSVEHREAVVAVHLLGCTYTDVAADLGVPVGTVKSRVFNGIRQLRDIVVQDELFGRWSS